MKFSKSLFVVILLLTILLSVGNVFATDLDDINSTDVISESFDETVDYQLQSADDSIFTEEPDAIEVEDWDQLQYYSSLNDKNYVLKLKENKNYYPTDANDVSYQIVFNNNVTILGASGAYIGDSSPNPRNITYTAMLVPDNNGVGITLKDVTFKWIGTRYQPDGVFLQMGGNAVNYFKDCYFTNISTNLGHSSIVHIKTGDAIIDNCTFINCTTDFGCLSVYNPDDDPTGLCTRARMNVSDSYFEGNYARTEPGCINNCGILVVRNSTFYKNSAFWWAGAIHTHGGANTTLYNTDFIDNLAGWNGGALYTYSYLQIYGCNFIGNNCTTNNGGGAIGACKYLHAAYIRIEDSLFENNENLCWGLDELSTSGTGRGGAISFMDEGSLEVYNSTFIKNSASIGTAICAIAGGLSYGSPNVIIAGNRFINHTRVGDVLDVRVATGSIAEVRDNYFENNSIVFSKLKLTADDPDSSGRVTMHLDAVLKNPSSYDQDILDKSDYDVYVNNAYAKTVSNRTFTLDLGNSNPVNVYVIPCISNSKSNEVLAGKVKEYIYVSKNSGNDNNDGLSRSRPVKTLSKSIELANVTENIIIMDGTFTETDLMIDYNLTITAESGVIIKVTGNAFTITNGDVKFENVVFKNCKYGSSTKTRLINQTSSGFLILDGCTFENNEYKAHIEADGMVEAENLKVTSCKDGSFIRANSIKIKSSEFSDNIVTYTLYKAILSYKTQTDKFEAENLTFTGNTVYSGCIGVKKNKATITDCSFIGNQVGTASSCRASGIHIEESCSVLVESCKFINNKDTGKYASVIYVSSGSLVIRDSILINNSYENTNGIVINGGETYLKKLQAHNNWWGNTPDNLTKPALKVYPISNQLPNGWDPAKTWLVLNVTSLGNELELNKQVPVQFSFTQIDNEGNITNYDGVKLPSFELELTAVNGTCSDSKITVENGMATTDFTLTQKSNSSLTGTFYGIESTINFQFKRSIPEMTIDTNEICVGDTANIVVNLESGATGSVVIKIGNITDTKIITNSKATFAVPNLPVGNYTIEANYTGNDIFESKIETANLTVNKRDSKTELSVGAIELGNDVVITISISNGATGTVDIYVNGVKETTVDAGQNFTIPNISRGNYVIRAVYSGDSYYLSSEDEYSFEVGKIVPSITVTALDITYGEDTIINVNLNSDATGNVTVSIDGKANTTQLNNGKANVSISGINAGTNKVINVEYTGDNNYKNATATETYNVDKASLDFTIISNNIKLGQLSTVTIQLPARCGGTLTITGIKSETKNIPLTGLVVLTYSDLDIGNYTVSALYNGDNYQTASNSTTFEVSDWDAPQWPNEGYDLKNTEKSPYSSDANGNVKWVKDINGTVIGNLAIDSEGRIYVVTADSVYSINPDDGSTNWIFNSQDAGESFSGIAIGRDTVLVPKEGDKLYFINQATGEKFNNNIYQGSSAFAPIVDENANIYISGEYYGFEPTKVVVVPYNIWQTSSAPNSIEIGNYNITSSPVLVNDNILIVATKTSLMGIELSSKYILFNIPVVSDCRPVVGPGNSIYIISNGHVLSYNVEGTKIKDIKITGTSGSYLSVGEYGEIYSINNEGKLFDYSTDEETLVYDFEEAISSRLLVGQDGNLYIGSESGMFYSIDTDGNLLWKENLNQSIKNAPVMDSNGVVYAISGNRLIAIDQAPLKDSNLTADIKNVTYGENVTVTIELDDKATGIVSIKIADEYMNESENTDGKISFVVPNLHGGNYAAEISYAGNSRFNPKQINVKFCVEKIVPTMNVDSHNIYVGDALQINVTNLPIDATGTVSVSIGDKSDSANIQNGKATLIISGLAAGEYDDVSVKYMGDVNYLEVNNSTSISVLKSSIPVNETTVVKSNDSSSFTVNLPSDATGNVTVTINNESYPFAVVNGKSIVEVPKLSSGKYPYAIDYSGNNKYLPFSVSGELVFEKEAVATVIVVESKFSRYATDFNAGERGEFFYATLYDVDGNPLANKTVKITLNGPIYNDTTGDEGKAGLQVNLAAANTYTYALLFSGDEDYNASLIASSKLTVVKKPTSIIANYMAFKTTAKTKTVTVALTTIKNPYDGKMYLREGKTITLTVNGVVYTAKTDKDGVANFNIKITKKGKYTATIKFAGDKTYEAVSKKITISISDNPAKNKALVGVGIGMTPADLDTGGAMNIEGNYSEYLINQSVSTGNYNKNKMDAVIEVDAKFTRVANDYSAGERGDLFYATLKDSNGNPIAGKTVQIALNGPIYKVVTDKDGKAGLQVNLAAANTYTYGLSFSGDDQYNAASLASSKLTVTKKATSISAANKQFKKSAKTKSVSVTLKTSKNPYDGKTYLSAGKQITLKVNGKTYTAKANKNGVAKFDIKLTKKGKYTAIISFAGDKTYDACKKSITITIK